MWCTDGWEGDDWSGDQFGMTALLLFGILPTLAALTVIAISIMSLARAPSIIQVLLCIPALAFTTWALFVLLRMLMGAWPTYLPYIALGIGTPLAGIQWLHAGWRTGPGTS